jgi:predicted NUDIX family NTP pyrophosphohydrolase
MAKHSAGILLYRRTKETYEVLLVHPGGPFWVKRDLGAWSIPKGEYEMGEESLVAAKREFGEEVGSMAPEGDYLSLGEFEQPSGKIVHVFALESDFDLDKFHSNMFQMEWPPKSGQRQDFPENDKASWLSLATARGKLVKGQVVIVEELAKRLGISLAHASPPEQSALF